MSGRDKARNKTERIALRATPDEIAVIDACARRAGLSRSAYIIECAARQRKAFKVDALELAREIDLVSGRTRRVRHRDPSTWNPDAETPPNVVAADGAARTERISIRASPYEKAVAESRARELGVSLTELVLICAVYRPVPCTPVANRSALRAVHAQLLRIGANVNQIARAANGMAKSRDGRAAGPPERRMTLEGMAAACEASRRAIAGALGELSAALADAKLRRR